LSIYEAAAKISREGTLLQLPDHKAVLSKEETEFMEKILSAVTECRQRPTAHARTSRDDWHPIKGVRTYSERSDQVRQPRAGSTEPPLFTHNLLPNLQASLKHWQASKEDGAFSVIEFRDASGIGRNLCIEILEYFDGRGFTRRDGNARLIRTDKDNIFG
jgi:selenocysteine-specific elongation factor